MTFANIVSISFFNFPTSIWALRAISHSFAYKMAGPEGINIQEQLALQNKALEAIDSASNELFELNQKIWRKPELAYQEKYAHEVVTSYLEKKGFAVTRHYSLETAFRAESEGGLGSEGLTVGVMCEYDALENIGHACGHNLIAEAGVATGIGKNHNNS